LLLLLVLLLLSEALPIGCTQPTSLSPGCGSGTSSTSATSLKDLPVRFATSLLYVAGNFKAGCGATAAAGPLVLASAWVCTLWTSQLADIKRRTNISSSYW
jgi:hypothetical protein